MKIGKKIWLVPDGYLPSKSNGDFVSHEAICVLNTGEKDANIKLTIYFEDQDPLKEFTAICSAERTNHIRLDKIKNKDGVAIPRDIPYALLIESDYEVVIQHSRLDTSQKELALMSTIAYG